MEGFCYPGEDEYFEPNADSWSGQNRHRRLQNQPVARRNEEEEKRENKKEKWFFQKCKQTFNHKDK